MTQDELKQGYSKKTLEDKFRSVKASIEIEGFVVTKEMEELILAEARGEITFEEMVEKAKNL